jgi:lipopolysaccharide/colanic/teichoic acid biosynthesis glycosyltransferase
MIKRLFDIVFSSMMLVLLSPVLIGITIYVAIDSPGGPFFRQIRVGRSAQHFKLWKFRTMRPSSEASGKILRKYKLDELPQLLNVWLGEMSMVGPRPEVPKYVALYNQDQKRVLTIRPGITDQASLEYFEENELLAKSNNPEQTYIDEIMPAKLKLNLEYLKHHSFAGDLVIIARTAKRMFF